MENVKDSGADKVEEVSNNENVSAKTQQNPEKAEGSAQSNESETKNAETDQPKESETKNAETYQPEKNETEKNAKIVNEINSGALVACAPLPKDAKRHKSAVFEVFYVVYDKDLTKKVDNYFKCRECDKVMHCVRSKGMRPLIDHPCVKKHKAKKAEIEKKAQEAKKAEEMTDDDGEPAAKYLKVEKDLLAQTFADFSVAVAKSGPLTIQQITKILPTVSTTENW